MSPYAHITGWGMTVPEKILTNEELAGMVDTSDEWIRTRTGIRERHIAGPDDTTASLAVTAALNALQVASLKPSDVDLIIVSTSSPEHLFPATACLVQDRIGAVKAGAFDLSGACSGFIYALNIATQCIRTGSIKNALVIGAETLSRLTNWKDRDTCILFGDGAGAFVLQASEEPGGLVSATMRSDGSGSDLLSVPAGGSRMPASLETIYKGQHYLQMKGREVFRFATRVMSMATKEVVDAAGLTIQEINLVIPHQANERIIDAAARALDIPLEKCVVNVDRYGNTSTASIPIATCEAIQQGRLQAGDRVVFVGFGAGLTWGAAVAVWTGPFLPQRQVSSKSYRLWIRMQSWARRFLRWIEG
ncbi:MAG: ketoacyl-ACP synthase III [Anaerolineales bacterium]|nr:ketoacyl-ACP synthase III [Anaerolineales bacterium]